MSSGAPLSRVFACGAHGVPKSHFTGKGGVRGGGRCAEDGQIRAVQGVTETFVTCGTNGRKHLRNFPGALEVIIKNL